MANQVVTSALREAVGEVLTIAPIKTGTKAIIPLQNSRVWFGSENIVGDPETFIRLNGIRVGQNRILEVYDGTTNGEVLVVNEITGANAVKVHVLI